MKNPLKRSVSEDFWSEGRYSNQAQTRINTGFFAAKNSTYLLITIIKWVQQLINCCEYF